MPQYKVKLDNNAVTVYEGAEEYLSMKVSMSKVYGEELEAEFNRVVLSANEVINLKKLDGSIYISLNAKRRVVVSSSLEIPSPLLMYVSSDKLINSRIGPFNTWSFEEGMNGLILTNKSSYEVVVEFISLKLPALVAQDNILTTYQNSYSNIVY